MKTLIYAEESDNKMILTYIKDYPDIINGKVIYRTLKPIDLQQGTVGKVVDDELIECPLEIVTLNLTEELKAKFLNQLTWTEAETLSGQNLLFPPNIEVL